VRSGLSARRGLFDLDIPESRHRHRGALERASSSKALQKSAGNVSRAARLLGLSRRTLQYRMEKMQDAPDGAPAAPKGAGAP
jgi:DNA-binding NtrC family response regulator